MTVLAAASASSSAEPGTLAFIVVFGMAVVLTVLFRSMAKHLRKVTAPRPGTVAASGVKTGGVATGSGVSDALANATGAADGSTRPAADRRGAEDEL